MISLSNLIAIVGAMDEEINSLGQKLKEAEEHSVRFGKFPLLTGRLNNCSVVIARSGIGKVNVSLTTQHLIDRFPLKAIINTGVAGGLHPRVALGDLIISRDSVQHDFDTGQLGYPRGVIPRLESSVFTADPQLVEKAVKVAQRILAAEQIHQGLIISGDQFVSSQEQKKTLRSFFPAALCVEMEGAALAHVAHLNNIPHLILRAVSDHADNTAPQDFELYLEKTIPILNQIIQDLVPRL